MDNTNKEHPFIAETHLVRAKSKCEAADAIWARLKDEILLKDGRITEEEARNLTNKNYRLTIDLARSITAVGYKEKAARDADREKARKKAAAKKAAAAKAKTSGSNGKVRTSKAA